MVTDEKTVDLIAERSEQEPVFCTALMAHIESHLQSISFTADYIYFEFQGDLNVAIVAEDICSIHRLLRPDTLDWTTGHLRVSWD